MLITNTIVSEYTLRPVKNLKPSPTEQNNTKLTTNPETTQLSSSEESSEELSPLDKLIEQAKDSLISNSRILLERETENFIRDFRRNQNNLKLRLVKVLKDKEREEVNKFIRDNRENFGNDYENKMRDILKENLVSNKNDLRSNFEKTNPENFEVEFKKLGEMFDDEVDRFFDKRVEVVRSQMEVRESFSASVLELLSTNCEKLSTMNNIDCQEMLSRDVNFDVELKFPVLGERHRVNKNGERNLVHLKNKIKERKEKLVGYQQNIIDMQTSVSNIQTYVKENQLEVSLQSNIDVLNTNIAELIRYVNESKLQIGKMQERLDVKGEVAPVVVNTVVDGTVLEGTTVKTIPVVVEGTSVEGTTEGTPVDGTPVLVEGTTTVVETTPVLVEDTPVVEGTPVVATEGTVVITEGTTTVVEGTPVVGTPVVKGTPVVEGTPVVATEGTVVDTPVEGTTPVVGTPVVGSEGTVVVTPVVATPVVGNVDSNPTVTQNKITVK